MDLPRFITRRPSSVPSTPSAPQIRMIVVHVSDLTPMQVGPSLFFVGQSDPIQKIGNLGTPSARLNIREIWEHCLLHNHYSLVSLIGFVEYIVSLCSVLTYLNPI